MEKDDFIKSMLTYLHLDDDPETLQELTAIVDGSVATIINGINHSLTYDDLKADNQFIMALRTLVSQTYYDRELANGYSFGFLSYVAPLQAKYSEVGNDETNS